MSSEVKKVLFPTVVFLVGAGVVVAVLVLDGRAGAESGPRPVREEDLTAPPVRISHGAMLAALTGAPQAKVRDQLGRLSATGGAGRRAAWRAAIAGLGVEADVQTRTRSARLAGALAARTKGKPWGPVDPEVVPALLSCLETPDAELVRHALEALGRIHLTGPGMRVSGKVKPKLINMLASGDPGLSAAAVLAVPMFKDTGLAGDVIAAWERHKAVKGFEARCLSTLGMLARQRLKESEKKADPRKPDKECWRAAAGKMKKLAPELGSAPAKWKTWWASSR